MGRINKIASMFFQSALKMKVASVVRNIKANITLKVDGDKKGNLEIQEKHQDLLDRVGALPMTGTLSYSSSNLASLSAFVANMLGKPAMVNEIHKQEKSNPTLLDPSVGSEIVLAKDLQDVKEFVENNGGDFAEAKPLRSVFINGDSYKLFFTSFTK